MMIQRISMLEAESSIEKIRALEADGVLEMITQDNLENIDA